MVHKHNKSGEKAGFYMLAVIKFWYGLKHASCLYVATPIDQQAMCFVLLSTVSCPDPTLEKGKGSGVFGPYMP